MMGKVGDETEQCMKLNWLIKGDMPTSFFYNKVNVIYPNHGSKYV